MCSKSVTVTAIQGKQRPKANKTTKQSKEVGACDSQLYRKGSVGACFISGCIKMPSSRAHMPGKVLVFRPAKLLKERASA